MVTHEASDYGLILNFNGKKIHDLELKIKKHERLD